MNTGDEGTTVLEIDVLQKAIALRDLALAEAQLRADENAAETAVLRQILAERDNALGRVEAAAQERAAALASAHKELELLSDTRRLARSRERVSGRDHWQFRLYRSSEGSRQDSCEGEGCF